MNPSRALLAALLLFPAALRAAETDSLDAQFSALKQRAKASAAASQAAAAQAAPPPAPVIVSGVDMSEFLRRLEDMTLDTKVLRGLLAQISVSFRDPTSKANAEYGWIVDNMYLPTSLKHKDRNAVRYDLQPGEIGTIIHELTHASADKLATSDAAAGSPGGEHYKALRMLSQQLRDGKLWAHYPNTKADELAGYYMGCAIQDVEQQKNILVMHSENSPVADQAEADRLGGAVFTFDQKGGSPNAQPAHPSFQARMNGMLGDCSVAQDAKFNDSPIGVEPDHNAKAVLFQNALGLNPPLSIRDLVKRLNDPARQSPGIQEMRQKIYKGRLFQLSRRR